MHLDLFCEDVADVRYRPLPGDRDALEFDVLRLDGPFGHLSLFGTPETLKALVDQMQFVVDAAARSAAVAAQLAAGDSEDPSPADPGRLVDGVPGSPTAARSVEAGAEVPA